MVFMEKIDHWWRVYERCPPLFNQSLSINICAFFFTLSLESSIMSFIEPPIFLYFSFSQNAHLIEYEVSCINRSFEQGGVNDVKIVAKIFELSSSILSFLLSFRTQWTINPSLENSILVHHWLSMSDEDDFNYILYSLFRLLNV